MGAGLSGITILTRREIEARIAGPMIKALIKEIGRDRVIEVVNEEQIALIAPYDDNRVPGA